MKYCIIIFFLLSSCKQQKGIHPEQMTGQSAYVLDEKFEDSLNIGLKGKNKIIIEKFKKNEEDEDLMVILRFFAKKNIWKTEI